MGLTPLLTLLALQGDLRFEMELLQERLLRSKHRVAEGPADLYFIPVSFVSDAGASNLKSHMQRAIRYVAQNFPFWNQTGARGTQIGGYGGGLEGSVVCTGEGRTTEIDRGETLPGGEVQGDSRGIRELSMKVTLP